MAAGRQRHDWSQTASLMALVATMFGKRAVKPEAFMPGERRRGRLVLSPDDMRKAFAGQYQAEGG